MTSPSGPGADAQPVERFKATSGFVTGYAGVALMALLLVYVAVAVHTVTGLRLALVAVFVGTLVWATQLRPRATAYRHRLVLRNSVHDVHIPLALVDDVAVRQTLNVWAGDRRYVCIGIGAPRRRVMRGSRGRGVATLLGFGLMHDYADKADRPALDVSAEPYESFVARRIEELAEHERRTGRSDGTVVTAVAWPEVTVLALSAVAFLISLAV